MKKKPGSMESFSSFIAFCLGSMFVLFGVLCILGLMKPRKSSVVQNTELMGIIFLSIGIVSCVAGAILFFIGRTKEKQHLELLETGVRVSGTVERVYLQGWTQYGHTSPYRVCYCFTYQCELVHRKSGLLWIKPDCSEGDKIDVYVNDAGKSTLRL